MGLFDFLKSKKTPAEPAQPTTPKRNEKPIESAAATEIHPGPTYLAGLAEIQPRPRQRNYKEWVGRLKSPSGGQRFEIRYYGRLHEDLPALIAGTDFAPAMVVALEVESGQSYILFDGCRHGYDALFCHEFTPEQVQNRIPSQSYRDAQGCTTFEVQISVIYNIDYDAEDEDFVEQVDKDGNIEILNGTKMPFETVKRDGYDAIAILLTNEHGKTTECLSEELA